MSVLIIAEAGVNHNGDIDMAKKLIDVASEAGANFVKFQTFKAYALVTPDTMKSNYQQLTTNVNESQYEMLKNLELSEKMHDILIEHCKAQNIGFLSTGFDIDSVNFLISRDIDLFKIPSGEITNVPYLRYIGKQNKPVIMSTGMSNLGDIEFALHTLEQSGLTRSLITVLHCTSEYPAPFDDVNLRAMNNIAQVFDVKVGYSDHTQGIEVSIAAVALGACVIEKHFTLDRNLPGPDHKSSLEPWEL